MDGRLLNKTLYAQVFEAASSLRYTLTSTGLKYVLYHIVYQHAVCRRIYDRCQRSAVGCGGGNMKQRGGRYPCGSSKGRCVSVRECMIILPEYIYMQFGINLQIAIKRTGNSVCGSRLNMLCICRLHMGRSAGRIKLPGELGPVRLYNIFRKFI